MKILCFILLTLNLTTAQAGEVTTVRLEPDDPKVHSLLIEQKQNRLIVTDSYFDENGEKKTQLYEYDWEAIAGTAVLVARTVKAHTFMERHRGKFKLLFVIVCAVFVFLIGVAIGHG